MSQDLKSQRHFQPIASASVDSDAISVSAALEVWRQTMGLFYEVEPAEDSEGRFHIHKQVWQFSNIIVSDGSFSAQRLRRDARRARTDGFDHYSFLVHRAGRWIADTGDAEVRNVARAVCVVDFAREFASRVGDNNCVAVSLPRDLLDEVMPPFAMHGLSLRGPLGAVLHDFLLELPRRADIVDARDSAHLMEATRHMLAACLAPSRDALALARPELDEVFLRRARRFVDDNLHDSELDAGDIGAALGLSRSTLYRMFRQFGGVGQFISWRRLARAHRLLADATSVLRIADVSRRCGYKSESHFSRAFRQAYGYAPSEARKTRVPSRSVGRGNRRADANSEVFEDWIRGLTQ